MKVLRLECFESEAVKPVNGAHGRPERLVTVVSNEDKGLRMCMLPGGAVLIDWGQECPTATAEGTITLIGQANVKVAQVQLTDAEREKFFK